MPRGRRGLAAVTLACAALAVAIAYLAAGGVRPAKSARAPQSATAAGRERAPTPRRTAGKARAPKRTPRYGIAFFGDSVSVGYGASDRKHGYVARVASWLRKNGKRVVTNVYAKGGVTVAYWDHARVPRGLRAAVIELGTNDVRLSTPPALFAQAHRTLTTRIRAVNPKAQLLCLSVWSRRGSASLEDVVNRRIRAVCPGTYVDVTRFRNTWGIRSRDGFHPNNLGYRLIARAVESRLKNG